MSPTKGQSTLESIATTARIGVATLRMASGRHPLTPLTCLVSHSVIASLTLGAERTFIMIHDCPPSAETKAGEADSDGRLYKKRWTLANGSLVVMQGVTQEKWKHEIPK